VVGGEKVIEGAAGHSGTATPMETVTRIAEVPSWGTVSREIPWWMRSAILGAWEAVVRGSSEENSSPPNGPANRAVSGRYCLFTNHHGPGFRFGFFPQ